jgi:DNA-binding Lrp family transcriptional regulator
MKAKISELTQKEYAEKMGVAPPAIHYRIRKNIPLPGIISIIHIGRSYALRFDNQTNVREAKKSFKIVHK